MSIFSQFKNSKKILLGGLGGGGDILASLPTYWTIKELYPEIEIVFAGINSYSIDNFLNYDSIELKGNIKKRANLLLWVTPDTSRLDGNVIEQVISVHFKTKCLLLIVNEGVNSLLSELSQFLLDENIDTVCLVDNGSDSIASINSKNKTVVTDAIALKVLSDLSVKTKILGMLSTGSDLEMDINTTYKQITRIIGQKGYFGAIGFPPDYLDEYKAILDKVLEKNSTIMTRIPIKVFEGKYGYTPLEVKTSDTTSFNYSILVYPVSLITWYFDPTIAAQINDFIQFLDINMREEELHKLFKDETSKYLKIKKLDMYELYKEIFFFSWDLDKLIESNQY